MHSKLFNFYLDGRSQIVRIRRASSDERSMTTCVQQESVLGLLLFFIDMNDFPTCLHYTTGNQFSDDKIAYDQADTAFTCTRFAANKVDVHWILGYES